MAGFLEPGSLASRQWKPQGHGSSRALLLNTDAVRPRNQGPQWLVPWSWPARWESLAIMARGVPDDGAGRGPTGLVALTLASNTRDRQGHWLVFLTYQEESSRVTPGHPGRNASEPLPCHLPQPRMYRCL